MNKKDIKHYLKYYSQIVRATETGKEYIIISGRRTSQKLKLPDWAKKLNEYVQIILTSETDPIVKRLIQYSIIAGKSDREVLVRLPISEGSYYRLKRMFVERIYELYIYDGFLSREEILKESISE